MKKLIITAALLVATTAFAAPSQIFDDHEETWFVHTETFGRMKDGVFVLMSKSDKATNKTTRFYLGTEYESCQKGFGELHIKEVPRGKWEPLTMFTNGGTTIGDAVSKILCAFAKSKAKSTDI